MPRKELTRHIVNGFTMWYSGENVGNCGLNRTFRHALGCLPRDGRVAILYLKVTLYSESALDITNDAYKVL